MQTCYTKEKEVFILFEKNYSEKREKNQNVLRYADKKLNFSFKVFLWKMFVWVQNLICGYKKK